MHDDFFLGKVGFGPAVGVKVAAQLRLQNERPKGLPGAQDNRRGGGVGGHAAVPAAQQVGGPFEAGGGGTRLIDGVCKAVSQFLVHLAVDIGLDGKHVVAGEFVAAPQVHVDALGAVGVG